MRKTIYYGGTFSEQGMQSLYNERLRIKNKIYTIYPDSFQILDPLRGKANSSLVDKEITAEEIYDKKLFTHNEIVHRDLQDIDKSDILFMEMKKPSIGSSCEIMYGNEKRKIIIVISDNLKVTKHPWVNCFATRIFSTVDEAIEYLGFLI